MSKNNLLSKILLKLKFTRYLKNVKFFVFTEHLESIASFTCNLVSDLQRYYSTYLRLFICTFPLTVDLWRLKYILARKLYYNTRGQFKKLYFYAFIYFLRYYKYMIRANLVSIKALVLYYSNVMEFRIVLALHFQIIFA